MAHDRVFATDNPHPLTSRGKNYDVSNSTVPLICSYAFPTPTSPKSTENTDLHDSFVLLLPAHLSDAISYNTAVFLVYRINVPSQKPSLKMPAIAWPACMQVQDGSRT